jgi:hypothetical protein
MTNNFSNVSGGVNLNSDNTTIGGDVVGRDKFVQEAPAPIVTALHQLPAPPIDFVGRTAELEAILSDLKRDTVIIGLRGLGGIGKTTLALVITDRMQAQYPDAQFYINLRGASDQPLSPAEALAHVIRAYHPTAKLPEAVADLQSLYRSVLSEQHAIILLDDANNAEQIKYLLPPTSCLLLITSRQHFTLPGLHATDLDTLSPDDARQLLIEIAPRLDTVITSRSAAKQSSTPNEIASTSATSRYDVASEIASLCGYLPQALRAAGSLLAVAIDLDPANYAAQLRNERTRLERLGVDPALGVSVEASLNLSYAQLSPEAQRVFARLSVFPSAFDANAEETICLDESHRHLSTLLQYSLAQYNPTTKRYSLHDLVRLFAAARLSPLSLAKRSEQSEESGRGAGGEGEVFSTHLRHAEYYAQIFFEASQLYLGSIMMNGLALFDMERPNIEQGQKWAQEHTREDQKAANACNRYGWQGLARVIAWPAFSSA